MITKENGLRYAKLIHVSVDNGMTGQSNKVYIMDEQPNGKINCLYGRVGADLKPAIKNSHEWDKVYRSKVNPRKGYTDVTDMIAESVTTTTATSSNKKTADIKCLKVRSLFDDLMSFANKSIQKNYKVTQESVTEAQVNAAQEILDKAVKIVKKGMDVDELNKLLIQLYTVTPRNMKDVRDYLATSANNDADIKWINNFLSGEQDTLDTMAGQVTLIKQQKSANEDNDEDNDGEITILEQMGLDVSEETDTDTLALIHKLLGSNSKRANKIFKCVNKKTQKIFDDNFNKAKVKKKRLYWHGSRNENWFNIIQTGLLIRPSGAIHTGSMFGDGIYFANKSQKSLGYSSLSGSYWANGNSSKGYLALFDVHLGNEKHITHHDSSCYKLSKKVLSADGYDSVYAHGGADLRNDEFIVYDSSQCTIAYIIEMR